MARIRRVGPVAAIFLLAGTMLGAQEPARVVGRVTDGAGNPVRGAVLELVREADGAKSTASSGETGGFEFTRLPAGAYVLRAAREGLGDRTTRVTVAEGERRTVITRLTAARRKTEPRP
jgi:hypothetical protein